LKEINSEPASERLKCGQQLNNTANTVYGDSKRPLLSRLYIVRVINILDDLWIQNNNVNEAGSMELF